MNFEQAKNLNPGDILHSTRFFNADGTPRRWRVNGRVKTWKRNPARIYIPLKHGLYAFVFLTEDDFDESGICRLLEVT